MPISSPPGNFFSEIDTIFSLERKVGGLERPLHSLQIKIITSAARFYVNIEGFFGMADGTK